jgi:hypothetical protein
MRLIFALAIAYVVVVASPPMTIQVGPNILVSRGSDLPTVEMMVAANPRDARNLIGAAITTTPATEVCTAYASFDGGYSWVSAVPPGLPERGSGDPQVAFTPDGTAYFSALGLAPREAGRTRFSAFLYRSRDGGLTWQQVATFGAGTGPDHDMMAVDSQGRVFISLMNRIAGHAHVSVYRLNPGAATIEGPSSAAGEPEGMAFPFTWNPVTMSDGALLVPFQVVTGPVTGSSAREVFGALSRDAGATFASPIRIGLQTLDVHNPVNPYGNVVFAVHTANDRFRDRIYMLWNDDSPSNRYRLRLASSSDHGITWTMPRDVDARLTSHANAFRPAIAVNRDGVVGISWLDSRESANGRTYREYFTASTDGGSTFLAPVVVSSVDSSLDAAANFASFPSLDSPRTNAAGQIEFSFMTILGRFADGGDYMGLAADAAGTFHPFWADTRTSTFQVWTAAVRVAPERPTLAPSPESSVDLTKRVRPVFDPASYDPVRKVQIVPVRFQNVSDSAVCAPLFITVHGDAPAEGSPQMLNADNHKAWDGASFDYSGAFRDLPCLAPGEMTEPVMWQVLPLVSERTFVTIRVTASHEPPGSVIK